MKIHTQNLFALAAACCCTFGCVGPSRSINASYDPLARVRDARIQGIKAQEAIIEEHSKPFLHRSPGEKKSDIAILVTPTLIVGDSTKFTTAQRTYNAMIMNVAHRVAEELRDTGKYAYVAVAPKHALPTGAADYLVVLNGYLQSEAGLDVAIGVAPGWLSTDRIYAKSFTRGAADARWKRGDSRVRDPMDEVVSEAKDSVMRLVDGWPLDADSGWAMQARCFGVGPAADGPLPKVGPKTKALVQKLAEAERKAFHDPYQLQVGAVSERVEPALDQYCDAMEDIVREKERISELEQEARDRASESRKRALVGGLLSTFQAAGNNYGNPYAFQAEASMIQVQYQSDINRVNDDLDTVLDANKDALRALDRAAEGLAIETGDAVKAIQIEFDGEQVELQGGTVAEQMKSFRAFAKKKLEQAIKEDALSS